MMLLSFFFLPIRFSCHQLIPQPHYPRCQQALNRVLQDFLLVHPRLLSVTFSVQVSMEVANFWNAWVFWLFCIHRCLYQFNRKQKRIKFSCKQLCICVLWGRELKCCMLKINVVFLSALPGVPTVPLLPPQVNQSLTSVPPVNPATTLPGE